VLAVKAKERSVQGESSLFPPASAREEREGCRNVPDVQS